jgi:hypothetical protein
MTTEIYGVQTVCIQHSLNKYVASTVFLTSGNDYSCILLKISKANPIQMSWALFCLLNFSYSAAFVVQTAEEAEH